MEIIKNNLNDLKQRWKKDRKEYNYFVSDGILNYEKYFLQSPKIMFLLKEANADFIDIAPLPIEKEGYGPKGASNTFWRYMRTYEEIIKDVCFNKEYDEGKLKKVKELPNNNTAYVNVKKQCENKPQSNDNDLMKYALKDKSFLNEQISLINPDIIYCGGTLNLYKVLDPNYKKISSNIYVSNKRIIIDFHHLSHRIGYKTFKQLYDLLNIPQFHDIVNQK